VPSTYTPAKDKATAASVMKFVSDLEDNDDVQNVYTNMDVGDDIMKEMEEKA
jgi:transcriptional/translational regulatory protein YebC/TACO1